MGLEEQAVATTSNHPEDVLGTTSTNIPGETRDSLRLFLHTGVMGEVGEFTIVTTLVQVQGEVDGLSTEYHPFAAGRDFLPEEEEDGGGDTFLCLSLHLRDNLLSVTPQQWLLVEIAQLHVLEETVTTLPNRARFDPTMKWKLIQCHVRLVQQTLTLVKRRKRQSETQLWMGRIRLSILQQEKPMTARNKHGTKTKVEGVPQLVSNLRLLLTIFRRVILLNLTFAIMGYHTKMKASMEGVPQVVRNLPLLLTIVRQMLDLTFTIRRYHTKTKASMEGVLLVVSDLTVSRVPTIAR